jgi:hypothetical protein
MHLYEETSWVSKEMVLTWYSPGSVSIDKTYLRVDFVPPKCVAYYLVTVTPLCRPSQSAQHSDSSEHKCGFCMTAVVRARCHAVGLRVKFLKKQAKCSRSWSWKVSVQLDILILRRKLQRNTIPWSRTLL